MANLSVICSHSRQRRRQDPPDIIKNIVLKDFEALTPGEVQQQDQRHLAPSLLC